MGGGVSKHEYERVRKELLMKDQVIRALQEKLGDDNDKVDDVSPPDKIVRSPSATKKASMEKTKANKGVFATVSAFLTNEKDDHEADQDTSDQQYNKRRVEVSAEVISSNNVLLSKQHPVYPKSSETKELILSVLQSNILFTGLSKLEVDDCLDAFFCRNVEVSTTVIQQGDQGDNFYVVESGQLEILVAVNGSQPVRYGFMGRGIGFGELALLYNMPRAATIRAVEDVKLWAIERQTFKEILATHKLKRLQKTMQVLKQVPILHKLTEPELRQVASAMEWEEYEPNTKIIQQGEVGEQFYIINHGDIMVTQKGEDTGEELEIRALKDGDHFGEMALFKEEVRSATCTATSHVQCLTLGREHFIAMLGTLQELMDREPNKLEKSVQGKYSPRRQSQEYQAERSAIESHKYYVTLRKEELEILHTLGRGAFGRVKLVRHAESNTAYALKCLVKHRIVENNLKEHVSNEKRVMMALDHPFVLRLYNTYQDSKYIYFLLEIALGGELFTYLRKRRQFDEATARFFVASVILVFQHMHSKHIVYRDLKPENILIDRDGYMKLADFGLAKVVTDRTWTLCGTPDYLAPEIILNKGHDKAADYWALGILIFEIIAGRAPFFAHEPMQIYALIIQGNIKFPSHFSRPCIDLVHRLLNQNPARRLGNMKHGIKDIINHKWFVNFNWDALLAKTLPPPFVPRVRDTFDTSNFEDFRHEKEDEGIDCDWDPDF